MKPKTTMILAAVLVVLAGIAFLFQAGRKKSLSATGNPIFPACVMAKVDGIDIRGKGRTVELRKRGKDWVVATEGGHQADPLAAKQILETIDNVFDTSNLVSTAKEKQSAFEVDSTGITVRVLQGGKATAEFVVGKPGPDYMSTYVRPVRQDRVYQIPAYLRSMVDRGKESWRNTLVVDADPATIVSVTARCPKQTIALEKDASGNWKITQPFESPGKNETVNYLLRSAGHIRAAGFADSTLSDAAAGLSPDTTKIEIKTTDGTVHALTVGTINDKRQSYVRKEGDPTLYLVPRGSINTIFRDPNTLKGEPSGPPVVKEAPPAK